MTLGVVFFTPKYDLRSDLELKLMIFLCVFYPKNTFLNCENACMELMGYIHEIFGVYRSNIISQSQLRVMLFIKTRFVGGHTFRLLIFVNLFQCQRMLICGVHSFWWQWKRREKLWNMLFYQLDQSLILNWFNTLKIITHLIYWYLSNVKTFCYSSIKFFMECIIFVSLGDSSSVEWPFITHSSENDDYP